MGQEIFLIAQIATMLLTASFLVINLLVTLRTARRKNILDTLTKWRSESRLTLIDISAKISANVKTIASDVATQDAKRGVYFDMVTNVSFLSYHLNYTWKVDDEIVAIANSMLVLAEGIVQNGGKSEELFGLYSKFHTKVSIYTNAEWMRIIQQAKGLGVELQDWYKDYYKTVKKLETEGKA